VAFIAETASENVIAKPLHYGVILFYNLVAGNAVSFRKRDFASSLPKTKQAILNPRPRDRQLI
jgi:hypothetical protein